MHWLALFSFLLLQVSCARPSEEPEQGDSVQDTVKTSTNISSIPKDLFTKAQAELILGEPAHLTDSAVALKGNVEVHTITYTADSEEPATGKTGNIYFLFEKYAHADSAYLEYISIYQANADHEGIEILHDMCDEAYFHTDSENFYFLMARKGVNLLKMKVNKITQKTSLPAFKQFTESFCL